MRTQGAVLVTLKKASALPAVDRNGLSDPYVKFTLDDHKRHSTTIKKSLSPVWGEKFEWLEVRALSYCSVPRRCCKAPIAERSACGTAASIAKCVLRASLV